MLEEKEDERGQNKQKPKVEQQPSAGKAVNARGTARCYTGSWQLNGYR